MTESSQNDGSDVTLVSLSYDGKNLLTELLGSETADEVPATCELSEQKEAEHAKNGSEDQDPEAEVMQENPDATSVVNENHHGPESGETEAETLPMGEFSDEKSVKIVEESDGKLTFFENLLLLIRAERCEVVSQI